MTMSDKLKKKHSFKVAIKLTAKSVRSHVLTFVIFENRIPGKNRNRSDFTIKS